MRNLLVLLLMCITVMSCFAGSSPSVTAQVTTADGITSYSYTITNSTAGTISMFDLFMPEWAARSVLSFTCPEALVHVSDYSFRGDGSTWAVGVGIAPGESKTAILTTPAYVPTSYTFTPSIYASNWYWNNNISNIGTSILPVPAPEPSAVLALAGGIAGVGGFLLRRRRR